MKLEVPFRAAGFCTDCGAASEEGYFDVAIHDCELGEWSYITFNRDRLRAWLQ